MAYSQQTMVAPHVMSGLQSARMMLPSEMEEEPVYVNARSSTTGSFVGARRAGGGRESPHQEPQAVLARVDTITAAERGAGSRFLTKKELAEMAAKKEAEKEAGRGAGGRRRREERRRGRGRQKGGR